MSKKPAVFIGSSKEGVDVAKAIQAELVHSAECELWSQGVFGQGQNYLESLIKAVQKFDFAIVVLTPDDVTESRKETKFAPRDNVIFELGLFIGGLGRERTFMVVQAGEELKMPSDLLGITTGKFHPPSTISLQGAVGPACTEIERAIRTIGAKDTAAVHIKGGVIVDSEMRRAFMLTVTNLSELQFSPYQIWLYHPKCNLSFFPSEKSGPLWPGQKREHIYNMFAINDKFGEYPNLATDMNGQPLDETLFELRLVVEEGEKVLYANKRLGRGLVKVIGIARETGRVGEGSHAEWLELDSSLPDVFPAKS